MVGEVKNSLSVPQEWPGLFAQAQHLLEVGGFEEGQVTPAAAEQLVGVAGGLGNEQLADNRKYGLGLLICKFAQVLYRPGIREELVSRMAGRLDRDYRSWRPRGDSQPLRWDELGIESLRQSFGSITQEAAANLTPPQRFSADTLAAVYFARQLHTRAVAEYAEDAEEGEEPPEFSVDLSGILNGTAARTDVDKEVMSGIRTTLRQAVKKAGLEAATLAEVLDSGVISDPGQLRKPAVGIASLRLDESQDRELLDRLTELDDNGNLIFDTAYLATPPGEPRSSSGLNTLPAIHRKRLICPAVHVSGLIFEMLGVTIAALHETQRLHRGGRARKPAPGL